MAKNPGKLPDEELPFIRIHNFGTFYIPIYEAKKLRIKFIFSEKRKVEKEEFDIVVQPENGAMVQNYEPFYFVLKDKENAKQLRVGETYEVRGRINTGEQFILDLKIMEAVHPFYRGYIELDHEFNFLRRKIKKVRV
jgi:hypothetical protein